MISSACKADYEFLMHNPGLRGDPHMWDEMKAVYDNSNVDTVEEFVNLLYETFKNFTGRLPESAINYKVKQFEHGGMSSGLVNGAFWIEIGFPLLVKQYEETPVT